MPKYKVRFKEEYMPREVERICDVPSIAEVKKIYDLNASDIEWCDIKEIDD